MDFFPYSLVQLFFKHMLSAEHQKTIKSRMHTLHERKMEYSSRDIAAFLKMQTQLELREFALG